MPVSFTVQNSPSTEDVLPFEWIAIIAPLPVGGGTDATRVSSYNPWLSRYWLVSGKTIGGTLYMESRIISIEWKHFGCGPSATAGFQAIKPIVSSFDWLQKFVSAKATNRIDSTLNSPAGANPAEFLSSSRDNSVVFALIVLTFITGLIDAVSYLGLGRVFTANMTGNVVLLGFAAAGVPGLSVARSLVSLVGFLIGAACGGKLGGILSSAVPRWLLSAAVTEAALIFSAAVAALGFDVNSGTPVTRLYAMIVLTAVAMGLRNATTRRLGVADLTTTVLTLTLTGLAADSFVAGGNNPRWPRRVLSVVAMFGGAALGALLLRYGLALPLAIAAAFVLGTTTVYSHMPSSTENRSARSDR